MMFYVALVSAGFIGGAVWRDLAKEWNVHRLGVELKPINPNKWTRQSVWQAVINLKNCFAWTHRSEEIDMTNEEIRGIVLHIRHVCMAGMRCGVLCLPKLALASNVHRIGYLACVRANYLELIEQMDILVSYIYTDEAASKVEDYLLTERPTPEYE
jgi:hypothetical protein